MKNKILVIHYEFLTSYLNKNIGYFIDSAIDKNFEVDFLTLNSKIEKGKNKNRFNIIGLEVERIESIKLYKYIFNNYRKYKYVWLYPSYKYFIFLLFIFKILNIKVILKTDSMSINSSDNLFRNIYRNIRKKLILKLTNKIIVENDALLNYFNNSKNVVKYPIGLSLKNISIIDNLNKKIKKEKIILYIGRINYAKGLDRLVNIFEHLIENNLIDRKWKLKVIGKVVERDYLKEIEVRIDRSNYIKNKVTIETEKSGESYYSEILQSSLVILPTRGEGLPNILADTYFCKRLFLTTTGAKVNGIIRNDNLFCQNNDTVLKNSIIDVINNIDSYYDKFDDFYNKDSFMIADDFFKGILND